MPFVMRVRGWLFSFGLRDCGKNLQVGANVMLRGLENISVGDDVYFAPGTVLLAGKSVTIGDGVQLAFYSVVTDGNHTIIDGSYRFGPRAESDVVISKGTWIGAHSTVVAGVYIGEGVLVGANSVVTRNLPSHCFAAGVPATVRRVGSDRGLDS